ncbi:MAG: hypothetical protein ACRBDX_03510 [Gammaproteobacteria bacterium]
MKKILIGLIAFVVIVAVGAYYLLGNLDNIVKATIEKYGSEVTQTSVGVGGVKIGLTDGLGSISNFKVANPKGFSGNSLFQMDNTSVQLSLERTSSELIVIEQVLLDGPSISYELGKGGSNVDVIKKNVDAYSGGGSDSSESGGPKLIIENLIIKNGDVQVTSNMMKGKTLSTKLPAIHLRDIGKDTGGATPAEVAKKVVAVLTKQIGNAAGKLDLRSLMDEEMLKQLGQDKLKDASGKTMDKLKDIGGGTGDKLKKLF